MQGPYRPLGPAWVTELLRHGFIVRAGSYQQTALMRQTIRVLTCAGVARRVSPWRGEWGTLVPGNDPHTADTGRNPWDHSEEYA